LRSKSYFLQTVICLIFMIATAVTYGQDITKEDCLECHGDKDLTKVTDKGTEKSLFIDDQKFTNSLHGDFSCLDCHSDIIEIPHEENLKLPDCNLCHEEIAEEYLQSFHGQALVQQKEYAPYCWDCHGTHYVYSMDDSLSLTNPVNLPNTCATCHSDPTVVQKYHISIPNPSQAYTQSIHYRVIVDSGVVISATCSACHGAHTLQPANDPNSMIHRTKIPETCSNCHGEAFDEYMNSIHGQALLAGVTDAPVCTDCHSEHSIKARTDPSSNIFTSVISQTTCSQCHESEKLNSKYGLQSNVVATYNDSYHGLANRGGSVVTANCASCHGHHAVLPSSDPNSMVHKDNLPATCGKCHPGVTSQVTMGAVHVSASRDSSKLLYYVTNIYISLIIMVIGGMVLHNGLDFIKKLRAKFRGTEEHPVYTFEGKEFVRLTLNERIQHFLLMFSFFVLVWTGFAAKFPEAWWAAPLIRWDGAFVFRGWLHRIAGAIMIILALYHLGYLVLTGRGRQHLKDFLPVMKDAWDVIDMFKYYIGLSKEKPEFARYNYIEKAEYWALIWGTVVMSLTGLVLWFNNLAMKYFPKWTTDLSTVIHYYEAILATLAIIVWHFYFQFLDPHVYPMNTTCITGKMTEEDMIKEHALEYKKLTES